MTQQTEKLACVALRTTTFPEMLARPAGRCWPAAGPAPLPFVLAIEIQVTFNL